MPNETIQIIGKTKSWFFEKINKIEKTTNLTRLKEKFQIKKIKDKNGMAKQIAMKCKGS
jgi:hypothetical protein